LRPLRDKQTRITYFHEQVLFLQLQHRGLLSDRDQDEIYELNVAADGQLEPHHVGHFVQMLFRPKRAKLRYFDFYIVKSVGDGDVLSDIAVMQHIGSVEGNNQLQLVGAHRLRVESHLFQ
jgi:hypothetical protein